MGALFMLRKRRSLSLNSSTKIKASLAFQIHQENTKQELSNVYLISGSKYHLSCTSYKTSIRLTFSALFGFFVVLQEKEQFITFIEQNWTYTQLLSHM
jgi:regulatory protein YycI of two-component signal transduction system YycFG